MTGSDRLETPGEIVFNLEVADDHSYFANGVLTHNCDVLASDDSDGLGEGNYKPDNVPTGGHPHCMCFTVSILEALPEEQWVSKAPRPDEVPQSQLEYYGFAEAA